jgi:hypothetical protein
MGIIGDREVVTNDDSLSKLASADDEVLETGVELGGPAGKIENSDAGITQDREQFFDVGIGEHFSTLRTRIDVAVATGLVAEFC